MGEKKAEAVAVTEESVKDECTEEVIVKVTKLSVEDEPREEVSAKDECVPEVARKGRNPADALGWREYMERELRGAAEATGTDVEEEMKACVAEAQDLCVKHDVKAELFEWCVMLRMAVAVASLRAALAEQCLKHGWRRRCSPLSVRVGDDFDVCEECTSACKLSAEELCAVADAREAVGSWSAQEAEQLRATVVERGGVCCAEGEGRHLAAGGDSMT
jgi:hypothetical protein